MREISEYFGKQSVTDEVLDLLVEKLKALTPLFEWTNGRIYKAVGGIEVDETVAPPFVYVVPSGEPEDTTPGGNSRLDFVYGILIGCETTGLAIPPGEVTILTVVDSIKGWLFNKQVNRWQRNDATALAHGVISFREMDYDSVVRGDDSILVLAPVAVTIRISLRTESRNPSPGTS